MGVLSCFQKPQTDDAAKSQSIDKKIKKEKKQFMMTFRIPVVGAGESGKSTLLKQMQILYINGFSDEEKAQKVKEIRRNIGDAMLSITGAMARIDPPVELEHAENQELVDYIQRELISAEFSFPPEFFVNCEILWRDKGVKETFRRANEYQLIDSAKYFLEKVKDVAREDFLPDNQDILRCRVLTSGIYETKFNMDKINFHMFDVGGQREERRKWIQVFHEVTAVIFVCACSAYDMTLREMNTQNRLLESIELFSDVWNNRYLRQNSVIIFLNKQDLFEDKILKGSTKLETYFPKFQHYPQPDKSKFPNDDPLLARAKSFIMDQFLAISTKSNDGRRHCYFHYTTAVDTENIKRVFGDCQDMLSRVQMQKIGMM